MVNTFILYFSIVKKNLFGIRATHISICPTLSIGVTLPGGRVIYNDLKMLK